MNKKNINKIIAMIVWLVSFILCENGMLDIGNIKVYADTDETSEFGYWCSDDTAIITGYSGKNTQLSIPSKIDGYTVTGIDYGAFAGCSNLTSITIPETVTSISGEAFNGCIGLKSIVIPKNVTYIGDFAFTGCSNLTSIIIPEKVKYIGEAAFGGCSSLKNIVVDKNNKVYDSRNNCNAIIEKSNKKLIAGCKNTVIPNGVKTIGIGAFEGCRGLKNVIIPETVTTIEEFAFDGCSDIKSVTIPKGVTSIETCAFSGCNSLESIVVDKNNKVYDSRNNCNAIIKKSNNSLISGCKKTVIPEGVTNIGFGAFSECDGLQSIVIPQSVKSIETAAFGGCSDLQCIEIPKSVIRIGYEAFGDIDYIEDTFIIYSPANSYAHKYALENDINWAEVNSKSLNQRAPYSTTSITMSWKVKSGVDGYEVYRANSKTGKYTKIKTTKSASLKDGKLKRGKTYYYKVRAYKTVNGKKVYGAFSSIKAMGTKPQTPSITVAAGNKKAKVLWKKISGISGYEVYMSEFKFGSYTKIKTSGSKNTAYLKTGLKSKSTYYFKVRSYRTVGGEKIYSSWSAVKSVKSK